MTATAGAARCESPEGRGGGLRRKDHEGRAGRGKGGRNARNGT